MFQSVQNRRNGNNATTEINIAPLIDMVFILLIFFLVTATFVRDTGIDVEQPQASQAKAVTPPSMRVSIAASGTIYTDGQPIALESLLNRTRQFIERQQSETVVVIPDTNVTAGRLVDVMNTLKLAGANTIAVAAQQHAE